MFDFSEQWFFKKKEDNNIKELLNSIETKLNEFTTNKFEQIALKAKEKALIISDQVLFFKILKFDLNEYLFLSEFTKKNLAPSELERALILNEKLEDIKKLISLINVDIITTTPFIKLSREQLYYLNQIQQKNQEKSTNIIINVDFTNNEKITLGEITNEKSK